MCLRIYNKVNELLTLTYIYIFTSDGDVDDVINISDNTNILSFFCIHACTYYFWAFPVQQKDEFSMKNSIKGSNILHENYLFFIFYYVTYIMDSLKLVVMVVVMVTTQ